MASFKDLLKMSDHFIDCVTFVNVDEKRRPCLHVSKKFEEVTGYSEKEVLGKNLRLLQGPLTNQETVLFMRKCFKERVACIQDIINYRKDGTPFLNRLLLVPLNSLSKGDDFIYAGFQNDITSRFGLDYTNESLKNVSDAEIKHVINNKLAIVMGKFNCQLEQAKSVEEVQKIQEELNRYFHAINEFSINIENVSEFEQFHYIKESS